MEPGQVLEDLLNHEGPAQRARDGRPRSRHVRRLTEESCEVDYDEPDQVFIVSVQRVPRLNLGPDQPVELGEVDGLGVLLTAVTVDIRLGVHLQFADDDRRRPREAEFLLRRDEELTQAAASGSAPPPDPAQSLTAVTIKLTDDLGTMYERTAGRFGGSGTEFQGMWLFQPPPPARARQLRITAQAAGQQLTELTLDLSTTSR
jgi:hypothetical protein